MSADAPRRLPAAHRRIAPPKPPAHLGAAGRALWRSVTKDFVVLEGHSLAQLGVACAAADRAKTAREAIDRDGAFIEGLHGVADHGNSPPSIIETPQVSTRVGQRSG